MLPINAGWQESNEAKLYGKKITPTTLLEHNYCWHFGMNTVRLFSVFTDMQMNFKMFTGRGQSFVVTD